MNPLLNSTPIPKIPEMKPFPIIRSSAEILADANSALEFHRRIAEYIIDFEKELDEEHEVGAKLVNFGEAMTIHVDSIGFYNPSLMCFYGVTQDGQKVQLIQHITQINFLLIAIERTDKNKPRIGFQLANAGQAN